ncbi:PAS domain-containing protein [Bradyrhizobium sp.]|uniref:PAS domain-containing protein n=1 Tax=Bradyrhizobium sp. TaxID=376 RepID=UPI0039E2F4F1
MARTLSDYLIEIAEHAARFDDKVLEHLCRMTALHAYRTNPPLQLRSQTIIGIWDWDVVNDRNHLDPNCSRLLGQDPDAGAKGVSNTACLSAVHPDDVAAVSQKLARAFQGGVYEAEFRIVSGGTVRRVIGRGYCTVDPSGRPERFPGAIFELDGPRLDSTDD